MQMLARLRGVLCDIDGTITTAGQMSASAYDALERLREAGLLVVPVTVGLLFYFSVFVSLAVSQGSFMIIPTVGLMANMWHVRC